MLIGPTVLVILVCIANKFSIAIKGLAEPISPPILALATVIFAFTAWRTKNPLCWVLAGLGFAFTCREIHFAGTNMGIVVALVVLAVWTVLWRKRLIAAAGNISHSRWVLASAVTYVVSKLVEKRVFRAERLAIIPNEKAIHVALEEGMELVAHLLLLLSAVIGASMAWSARNKADDAPDQTKSQ